VARIVFLNPFSRSEITGGIKTAHRHAELLAEMGFDSWVHQPDGAPSWFESKARLLPSLVPETGDVLVFPEVLNGGLAELAQAHIPAKKVLFCQAQFYTLFNTAPPARYRELGFAAIACQSEIAKRFLEDVLRLAPVSVIPCFIDTALFFPRAKSRQIAFIPKKLPREAAVIQSLVALKYPRLGFSWRAIENASERQTAEIFGASEIVLSLPFLESFGLVPLEAMASAAIAIGFDGYGGQDYMTSENGFWFRPDRLEDVADAIARVAEGLMRSDPVLTRMRDKGLATVQRYNRERTRAGLRQFYGGLI
jgi:glycosyltransferase involved in cell wall biosynthesis